MANGVAKVGRVAPGTKIELYKARWELPDTDDRPRKTGDQAVLKTLRLDKRTVQSVERGQQMGLRAGRPQQGTIVHWHKCGTRLADLIERRPPPRQWGNLSTEQQEAACAEFLRLQRKVEELPRLHYLLLPVGRTLEDVDIYGIAEDGREVFAQVTYLSRDSKSARDKVSRLKSYGSGDAHLIFFGAGSGSRKGGGVIFASVEDEVMGWIDDDPEFGAALFPES